MSAQQEVGLSRRTPERRRASRLGLDHHTLARGGVAPDVSSKFSRPLDVGSARLLVADDDAVYLTVVSAALEAVGFEVEPVTSGEAALQRLSQHGPGSPPPPDCVLIDRVMPGGITGDEAIELVRRASAHPHVPIIMVTSCDDRDAMLGGLGAGADDYVVKGGPLEILAARVRTQIQRGRQQRDLARALDTLSAVIASVPHPIVATFATGRIALMNEAAERLSSEAGLGEEVGAWMREVGFERVAPDDASDLPPMRALAGEAVDRVELSSVGPGGPRYFVASARPLLGAGGEVIGAVAAFRDVTAERSTQHQLLQTDRMATLGILAASVGHEINNPLAVVTMNVEHALSRLGDGAPEEAVAALREARSAAERIRDVTRDLGMFVRDEDPRASSSDVHAVVESSARFASNEIRHKARLEIALDPVPRVRGPQNRLGQVILNLLLNAAQAIPSGQADRHRIRVTSTFEEAEGVVRVSVADSGPGISPSHATRIFEPLFTTKQTGTGLGLAICQRILGEVGGTISLESKSGEGATFHVRFPLADPEPPLASSEREVKPADERARTILVIDDEPALLRALTRRLERDHAVTALDQAREALERIRRGERFDLILCDIMMPVVTGLELLAAIEAIDAAQARRVVFITGGVVDTEIRAALDALPNPKLEKPFDMARLREIVAATPKLPAR